MTLYAVHVQGPDDIIAAPSMSEAEALAGKLNAFFAEIKKERGENYPSIDAIVIKWPFNPSAHAAQLADDWAEHATFIGPIEPERDTKTIDMFQE